MSEIKQKIITVDAKAFFKYFPKEIAEDQKCFKTARSFINFSRKLKNHGILRRMTNHLELQIQRYLINL